MLEPQLAVPGQNPHLAIAEAEVGVNAEADMVEHEAGWLRGRNGGREGGRGRERR